jgi:hypothetical protein
MAKRPSKAAISLEERGRRALHVTLRASARVAMETGVELKGLKRALEDAYVHEALERGWPLKTIGETLGVSPSKTALLSRQLKKGLMSRLAQEELALERRLEYMLWAKPMTLARLNQVLPQERYSDLSKALKVLVAEERVVRRGDGHAATYALRVDPERRPWERYLARLDGAQRGLVAAADAVRSLFVRGEEEPAQVHSLEIPVAPDRVPEAREAIERAMTALFTELQELSADEDAPGEDDVTLRLGTFWAADGED